MAKSVEQLEAELKEMAKKLELAQSARTEAEKTMVALAEASTFFGSAEERATGKTITQEVCINPWEKDEKKQKFKDVEVPTYYYTMKLPVNAGLCLTTNGQEFYHGQTYQVTQDVLADLKSRVARCHDHERAIKGEDQNAYRRATEARV